MLEEILRHIEHLDEQAEAKGCVLIPILIPQEIVDKINIITDESGDVISGDDVVIDALRAYLKYVKVNHDTRNH